jgi:hypothetical protein
MRSDLRRGTVVFSLLALMALAACGDDRLCFANETTLF